MATYTETFNQANSTTLGPDLTWTEPVAGWSTVSNQATMNTQAVHAVVRAEVDLGSANHAAEVVITTIPTANYGHVAAACRVSSNGLTHYQLRRGNDGSPFWRFSKFVAGVETNFGTRTVLTASLPETWRLEVEGTTLRAYRGGVLQGSSTDSSITTGNFAGMAAYASSGVSDRHGIIDTFTADDLAPASSITAGADQSVLVDSGTVTLTATGTPAGGAFAWSVLSGSAVTLSGASTATATFAAPSAAGSTTLRCTYTPPSLAAITDDVVVTYTLPAVPTASHTKLSVVEVDASASSAPTALAHTSGTAPTSITSIGTDVYKVVLPASFTSDMVLTLTVTDAYAQVTTQTVTITPAGGTTVQGGVKVRVGGVYV